LKRKEKKREDKEREREKRECIYGIQQGRESERKIYKFRNAINEREERERERVRE
jgi:hypothetical protein